MLPSYIISAHSFGDAVCNEDFWWFREHKRMEFNAFEDAKRYYEWLQSQFTNSISFDAGKFWLSAFNVISGECNLCEVEIDQYFIEMETFNGNEYTNMRISAFEESCYEGYNLTGEVA